jgi:hypothetical protein
MIARTTFKRFLRAVGNSGKIITASLTPDSRNHNHIKQLRGFDEGRECLRMAITLQGLANQGMNP